MSAAAEIDSTALASAALAEDILDALTRPFKELPPKYLYDERGSELFDRICELPEYYPTRTERWILEHHAGDIADFNRNVLAVLNERLSADFA